MRIILERATLAESMKVTKPFLVQAGMSEADLDSLDLGGLTQTELDMFTCNAIAITQTDRALVIDIEDKCLLEATSLYCGICIKLFKPVKAIVDFFVNDLEIITREFANKWL